MSPKMQSLKEIYERSNLSMLLDSSVQTTQVIGDLPSATTPTNLHVTEAFYLQVLHATSEASPADPGALT